MTATLRDDAANVLLESSLDMPHGEWSGSDFEYDRNGNQTRDLSRDVADIVYNELNLPERVEMDGGGSIEYLYSAAGTKLAEIVRDEDDQIINRRDYAGLFEYEADSVMRIAVASGYITVADTVYHLYVPDYQGNIVAVYNTATGQQEHYKDYYPYGLPHAEMPKSSSILPGLNPGLDSGLGPIITIPKTPEPTNASTKRRWYSAKKLTTDHGLNTYDFEARILAPAFPRFTSVDPLGEENLHITLYSMCNGDPINFVDPTGMTVILSGDNREEYAKQLSLSTGNALTLTIEESGQLSYSINENISLSDEAKKIIQIIEDDQITVQITTVNGNTTTSGESMVGGAFMGNIVVDENDGQKVFAFQEVDVETLSKMSDAHGKPGQDALHELDESYNGAKISLETGISASKGNANNSIYNEAHNRSVKQSRPIHSQFFNKNGQPIFLPETYRFHISKGIIYVNDVILIK